MANIDIIISGQATKAADSVDTLIDKLNSLSSKLVEVGQNARKAFSEFNTKFDDNSFGGFVNQMNDASEATAEVRTETKETTREISNAGKAASKSAGLFGTLGKSIGRIAFYRAIRSAIKAVTQAVKEGIDNYYKWSKATSGPFATAMDKLKSSASQMKNQFGAAFGALATSVMPVVNMLVNALTKLARIITMVFSLLNGRSTYDEAVSGFEDVGNAASGAGKKVKGLLAPWDELNVIGQEKSGGGGGALNDAVDGLFEEKPIPAWLQEMWDRTTGLKENIEAIKDLWNRLVERFEEGDFKNAVQIAFLDPLNSVLSVVENAMLIINAFLSGDWLSVDIALFKLIFDSLIDTVFLPFSRTIDGIFGTDISGVILNFKKDVDEVCRNLVDPNNVKKTLEKAKKNIFDTLTAISVIFIKWRSKTRKRIAESLLKLIDKLEPVAISIASFFDDVTHWYKTVCNGIAKKIVEVFNWINSKLINPVIRAINKVGKKIAEITGGTWTDIQEIGMVSIEAFDQTIEKSDECANAVKRAFSGMRTKLLQELSAEPTIRFKYKDTKIRLTWTMSNGQTSNIGQMQFTPQTKAEGGFVDKGQLFVAREAGPEMVGSIGNRTAVANNDQIVSGIASGVREAESEQNALLRQQNSILMQLLNKDLVISPSAALGQVVARSNALYARS